jgi:hypothetical protein
MILYTWKQQGDAWREVAEVGVEKYHLFQQGVGRKIILKWMRWQSEVSGSNGQWQTWWLIFGFHNIRGLAYTSKVGSANFV